MTREYTFHAKFQQTRYILLLIYDLLCYGIIDLVMNPLELLPTPLLIIYSLFSSRIKSTCRM